MSAPQEYFVPGFGISRQVMFSHLQFHLGPDASVRPYSYQVRTTPLAGRPRLELPSNTTDADTP